MTDIAHAQAKAATLIEALPWLEQPWRKEEPAHFAWRPYDLGGSRNARLRSPLDLDILINGKPASRSVASAWFMTYPFNMLSQLPVISVPSGFAANGVPTGIQIVSRAFDDLRVLDLAQVLENIRPWRDKRPDLLS